MPDEGCALFDDDAHGLQIAKKLGVGFEFAALLDSHVAVHCAVDRDGLRANLTFHNRIFPKDECALGDDLTIQLAVKNEFGVELECSSQFHITGENVFGSGGFGDERGDIVEVHDFAETTLVGVGRSTMGPHNLTKKRDRSDVALGGSGEGRANSRNHLILFAFA